METHEALLEKWNAHRLTAQGFSEIFLKAWKSTNALFFKYEAHQYYNQPDDPSFEALTEGKLYKAARLISEQIMADKHLYESAKAHGVRLVRVHAIKLPLSYYLQYEFMSYLTSQRLGEEIRVVDLHKVKEIGIRDFLLFDDRFALVHNYVPPTNTQDGGWLVEDPTALDYLKQCRHVLTERSATLDNLVIPGVPLP